MQNSGNPARRANPFARRALHSSEKSIVIQSRNCQKPPLPGWPTVSMVAFERIRPLEEQFAQFIPLGENSCRDRGSKDQKFATATFTAIPISF
jgi:hypothetical protein